MPEQVLLAHVAAVEKALIQTSKIPANSGHPLHKGTPRESFIRQFLGKHLARSIQISSGEVIASSSMVGEPRNQFDIVLYRDNFPRIDFGGGINAFFIESLLATIEVKSNLTKEELKKAVSAAQALKKLPRDIDFAFSTGYVLPAPLSFVIAYDGPANMETVRKWLTEIHAEEGIAEVELPTDDDTRLEIAGPSVDGVFVLERGFVQFDNLPISFLTDDERVQNPPTHGYYVGTTADGTLLSFFVILTQATAAFVGDSPDLVPYLQTFNVKIT